MAKNRPTSNNEDIATAIAATKGVELLDKLSLHCATFFENGLAKEPLTADKIEDHVDALMQAAIGTFFEPCLRILANNGKAYPVDYDFDSHSLVNGDGTPVEPEELVERDRYAFLNEQVARSICSGLDMVLRNQNTAIANKQKQIQNEIRFGRNAGTDVTDRVERMADFLEVMVEQAALVQVALNRAVEAYATATGKEYIPQADRESQAKERTASVAQTSLGGRLAKLGVKLN